MYSSNRNIFLKVVIVLTITLAFSHASAQNYEIEKYLNYYDLELERIISRAEYARDYEKFRDMLETRYNVLKAVWESDRDRLKEIARDTGDSEEAVDDLDRQYDEWEKRSEKRISRSKAEYIAGQSAPDTGEMEVTRLELIEMFSQKYDDFIADITSESREVSEAENFQDYKSGLVSGYREKAQKLDNLSDLQYETLKLELKGSYQGEGIEAEHFDGALEREKRGMLYERKLFLTQLLNTYVNRGYRDLVTDRSSLRMEMEKDRAAQAAEELQDRVNQELGKSIDERLDSLLREEVLTAEDAFAISGRAKNVYDEGLKIWGRAAADLVRMENEWYSNYNEIYNEGVVAWAEALGVLKQKREEWDEEFSGRIESGLANWEEVFSEAGEAKETLVSNYVRYKDDRERDLNAYIGNLEDTLMYGSGSIEQIDRYTDEFKMMTQDRLRYFTDKKLAPGQLDGLIDLFSSYKGKEASFWQLDMDLSDLFDFKTKDLRVWIFFKKRKINSRTDKIVDGPRYDLISKKDLSNGFQLKVRLGATIRRYGKWKLNIFDKFWTINSNDVRENKYYYVTCTYDENGSWSRKAALVNSETGSFSKIVSELPVAKIAEELDRYSNVIDLLNRDKKEIIDSVRDVQGSIVRMLDENLNVLDGPVFQNEEEFEEYFFGPENEFFMDDFDRALYKAYYEKKFWGDQFDIVDDALEYALDKAGREDYQSTIDNYETQLIQEYEEALSAYNLLTGNTDDGTFLSDTDLMQVTPGDITNLRDAGAYINSLVQSLEDIKAELGLNEELLRQVRNELSGTKIAKGDLDLLLNSMFAQVSQAVGVKHEYLQAIGELNEEDKEEAFRNLLDDVVGASVLRYDKIIDEYYDPDIKTSLVSMLGFQESYQSLIEGVLASEVETVSTVLLGEAAENLGGLLSEISGNDLYSGIVYEIENLKYLFEEIASGSVPMAGSGVLSGPDPDNVLGGDTAFSKELIIQETIRELYLINSMFNSLIEGKKLAYSEYYGNSDDPSGYFNEEKGRYFDVYMDDVDRYLRQRTLDISEIEEMLSGLEILLRDGIDSYPEGLSSRNSDSNTEGFPDSETDSYQGMLPEIRDMSEAGEYISITAEEYILNMQAECFDAAGLDPESAHRLEGLSDPLKRAAVIDRFIYLIISQIDELEPVFQAAGGSREDSGQEISRAELNNAISELISGVSGSLAERMNYWKELQLSLESSFEADIVRGSTVEEMLVSARDEIDDKSVFLNLKELFTMVLPDLTDFDISYNFADSRDLWLKNRFYSLLLNEGGGIADIGHAFDQDVIKTGQVAGFLFDPVNDSDDIFEEIFGRLESGYYDKGNVGPIDGSLDRVIVSLFSNMEAFEENGILGVKLGGILRTMADYVAAAIYLEHGAELDNINDGDKEYEVKINNWITKYFNDLKDEVQGPGLSEDEMKKIEEAMADYLVGSGSENDSNSRENFSGLSSNELIGLMESVKGAIDDIELFYNDSNVGIGEFFTVLLESDDWFARFEELETLLGVGLLSREEYEDKLEYSHTLGGFFDLPAENYLKDVVGTAYIDDLLENDEDRALDIITALSLYHFINYEIPVSDDFESLYVYIDEDFTRNILGGMGSRVRGHREEIKLRLGLELKLYEARLMNSGVYDEDVRFSGFADDYAALIDELDGILKTFAEDHRLYTDFGSFINMVEGFDSGFEISEHEIDLLKQKYIDTGLLMYGQKYYVAVDGTGIAGAAAAEAESGFISGGMAGNFFGNSEIDFDEAAFKEKYLNGFDEDFQYYLFGNNVLGSSAGYDAVYREYLLDDPVEKHFFELAGNLYNKGDSLESAVLKSYFKRMIEERFAELAAGEDNDYRGVIFDSMDIWEDVILPPAENTDPSIVSARFNYQTVGGTPENVLSKIYFEGFGNYEYGDENKTYIDTAITFISEDARINSYIEYQNRFIQSLMSLINLKAITDVEAEQYLESRITFEIDDENMGSLNIFSELNGVYSVFTEESGENLKNFRNILKSIDSGLFIADREARMIESFRFDNGGLLDTLGSAGSVDRDDDLDFMVATLEIDVSKLELDVEVNKNDILTVEDNLSEAKGIYNNIVVDINRQKDAVDKAYKEYLKAKEKYFFAINIYMAGDDPHSSVEMYKNQLVEYAGNEARVEERYRILKAVRMKEGDIDNDGDELAALFEELEEKNSSLNLAEEALQLLKLFSYLYNNELGMLESRIASIDESLKDPAVSDYERDELTGLQNSLITKRDNLTDECEQYTNINFDPDNGSVAYILLRDGLREIGNLSVGKINSYITALGTFIKTRGGEIFSNGSSGGNENTSGLMVVELEEHVLGIKAELEEFKQNAEGVYRGRVDTFNEDMRYTDTFSRGVMYNKEMEVMGREKGYLVSGLSERERSEYESYVSAAAGKWEEVDLDGADDSIQILLMLEKRKEELEELILLYEVLSGARELEGRTGYEIERWGAGLEKLAEKYNIEEGDIIRYEDVVKEGILLESYDMSGRGLLRLELERIIELFDGMAALDYYNTVIDNGVYGDLLNGMRMVNREIGEDKAELEEYRFGLQIAGLTEEGNRYKDKVNTGKENGYREWDEQYTKIYEGYREWLYEMRGRYAEAEEGWKDKKVDYVKKRGEWFEEVSEGSIGLEDEVLKDLEEEVNELAEGVIGDADGLRINGEEIEREYIKDVTIPRWISDYEAQANMTFGYRGRLEPGNGMVEESIQRLRENIKVFEGKKSAMEAEKIYFKLKKTKEMILAEIRMVDEGNKSMVDEVMEGADFKRVGGGYEKKVLVDYSVLLGKKKEKKRIRSYLGYELNERMFELKGIEEFKGIKDSTERNILMLKETERIRASKEEVLGTEDKAGKLYKDHIGRFPTGGDVGQYIKEKQRKKGFFESVFGIGKALMEGISNSIASLFGKGKKDSQEEYTAFQALLVKEIGYTTNKELETGRIMLEYQRLEAIEGEAKEKKDAGFFNAPLVPGGPSLKSVGSVALAIGTAGQSVVLQSALQVGWGAATAITTAAEGKMEWHEAGLSIMKDAAITAITGGFSSTGGGIGGRLLGDVGSVSRGVAGVGKAAMRDAGKYAINQTAASAINAFEIDRDGIGWNSRRFVSGFGTGLLGSVGALGGSLARNQIHMMQGAEYANGGFTYFGIDGKMGAGQSRDMLRLGNVVGGLSEQAINNMTGVADGYSFNVLNSEMFGAKHGVGMVSVNVGGRGGFGWDVSMGGIDVSYSGIEGMVEGIEEVGRYNLMQEKKGRWGEMDAEGRWEFLEEYGAYIGKNVLYNSLEGLNGKEYRSSRRGIEGIGDDLDRIADGSGKIGIVYGAGMNKRINDTIYLEDRIVRGDDKGISWSMNEAAKVSSVLAHEWEHDGVVGGYEYEVMEDIKAHTFDTVVWKGLKEKFGVYNSEMDEKLLAYTYGGEQGFEEYLGQRYELGEEANIVKEWAIGARLKFMEARVIKDNIFYNRTPKDLLSFYSLLKGFKGREEEWGRLYDDTGIINVAQGRMMELMDNGYDLMEDKDGMVKATEVLGVDFGNAGTVEGYVFLSQMMSSITYAKGAVLTQRFGIEHDKRGRENIRSDYYAMGYRGPNEGVLTGMMDRHVKEFADFINVVNNPEVLKEIVKSEYVNIQRSLQEGEGWDDPAWLMGEYEKGFKAQCNLGFANMMNMFGFDRYYGRDYMGDAHLTKDPKTDNEILASEIIEDLKKHDSFETLDQAIDFDSIGTAQELQEQINNLDNYAILMMENYTGGSSHISVLIGGESYDVNFRPSGEYGSVELWATVGGENRLKNIFSNALKFETFDFKDEWLKEKAWKQYSKNNIEKTYNQFEEHCMENENSYWNTFKNQYEHYFKNFEYEILIPKYSVSYQMDLEDLWYFSMNY